MKDLDPKAEKCGLLALAVGSQLRCVCIMAFCFVARKVWRMGWSGARARTRGNSWWQLARIHCLEELRIRVMATGMDVETFLMLN